MSFRGVGWEWDDTKMTSNRGGQEMSPHTYQNSPVLSTTRQSIIRGTRCLCVMSCQRNLEKVQAVAGRCQESEQVRKAIAPSRPFLNSKGGKQKGRD